ncbi:MAG: hypothetical protein K8S99_00580 [Planctomycetes bacterium]|nr:hypothetical protein [Planctomycetota bacterium]
MIGVRFAVMVGVVACVSLPAMGQTSERERLRRDRDMSVYRGGVDGGDAARLARINTAERVVDTRRIAARPLVGSAGAVRQAVYVTDAPASQNPVIYPEDKPAYDRANQRVEAARVNDQVQTQVVESDVNGTAQLASHSSYRVGVGYSGGGTAVAVGYSSHGYGHGYGGYGYRGYGYGGYAYRPYYAAPYCYPAPYYCPAPVAYYGYSCPPPAYYGGGYCGPSFGIGYRSGYGHCGSGLSLFFSTRF